MKIIWCNATAPGNALTLSASLDLGAIAIFSFARHDNNAVATAGPAGSAQFPMDGPTGTTYVLQINPTNVMGKTSTATLSIKQGHVALAAQDPAGAPIGPPIIYPAEADGSNSTAIITVNW